MSSEKVIHLTDANFEEEVVNSQVPVLVDFWAEWCMPCRMIAPTVEELAEEYDGKVKFGKLNTDDSRQTAVKFNISAIPTLLLFKDGQVANKIVGVKSKRELKEVIDGVLS